MEQAMNNQDSPKPRTPGTPANDKPLTGKHVAIGLFLMFVVVASVNGGFIFASVNSFAGLTNDNAYYDGLKYEDVLEASRLQQELGWMSAIDQSGDMIQVSISDKTGAALGGLTVTAQLIRPANDHGDVSLSLPEQAAGQYRTKFVFPVDGQWYLDVRALLDGKPVFRLNHHLMVEDGMIR